MGALPLLANPERCALARSYYTSPWAHLQTSSAAELFFLHIERYSAIFGAYFPSATHHLCLEGTFHGKV